MTIHRCGICEELYPLHEMHIFYTAYDPDGDGTCLHCYNLSVEVQPYMAEAELRVRRSQDEIIKTMLQDKHGKVEGLKLFLDWKRRAKR